MHLQPKEKRINRTFSVEPKLYEDFRKITKKRESVKSYVLENFMRRYINTHS
jgi:hypothetical protein